MNKEKLIKAEFNQPGFLLTSFHQDIIWYDGETSLVGTTLIKTSCTLTLQSLKSISLGQGQYLGQRTIQFMIEKIQILGFNSAFKRFITTLFIFLATKHESKP